MHCLNMWVFRYIITTVPTVHAFNCGAIVHFPPVYVNNIDSLELNTDFRSIMIEAEIIQSRMLPCWILNPHFSDINHIQWGIQALINTTAPSSLKLLKGMRRISLQQAGARVPRPVPTSPHPYICMVTLTCHLQLWALGCLPGWCTCIAKMAYPIQCPLIIPDSNFLFHEYFLVSVPISVETWQVSSKICLVEDKWRETNWICLYGYLAFIS